MNSFILRGLLRDLFTETEINVFERRLYVAPVQNSISKPEVCQDFGKVSTKMTRK